MKIIEALKTIKLNRQKIADFQQRISKLAATTNLETPQYGEDQKKQVEALVQSCHDLGQDNIALTIRIQKTNLATPVSIDLGDKTVTRTIAEWVARRREYAGADFTTYSMLSDRGIKEGHIAVPGQTEKVEIKIVRHFDVAARDAKLDQLRAEPILIDSALEIINAVTDLHE